MITTQLVSRKAFGSGDTQLHCLYVFADSRAERERFIKKELRKRKVYRIRRCKPMKNEVRWRGWLYWYNEDPFAEIR